MESFWTGCKKISKNNMQKKLGKILLEKFLSSNFLVRKVTILQLSSKKNIATFGQPEIDVKPTATAIVLQFQSMFKALLL